MTERPILFSAPMVRALIDGTKTQTRRIVKSQPPASVTGAGVIRSQNESNGVWSWMNGDPRDVDSWMIIGDDFRCHYGIAGDRLWVREGWRYGRTPDGREVIEYRADGGNDPAPNAPDHRHWRSSIHLRRRLARITLEVVDVRVERLHDITDKDAIAEGIEREGDGFKSYETIAAGPHKGQRHPHAIVPNRNAATSYLELFYAINAKTPPGSNPWVWVVEFRRVQC